MKPAVVAVLLFVGSLLPSRAAADAPRPRPVPFTVVEATLPEIQLALHLGAITSERLVQAYLDRIAAYDQAGPRLNSFLHVNEHALETARQRDRDRQRGCAQGPLFGVPVLLKDNIDTRDLPTTAGALALAGSVPPHDATVTRKLREAGAVILGKATMTELANFLTTGMPAGYSSLGGYGLNPYDPRPLPQGDGRPALTPGGSSSGSGIATAASLVAVAVGTETSGSILSPAHQNGVVGVKPTVGLVSRTGIIPITADQDTAGPIARTVGDAAILLGALAGYDPTDPATAVCLEPGKCLRDYTRFLRRHALRGARIAVPRTPYWVGLSAAQQQVMLDAMQVMRDRGAFIDDGRELPNQAALSAFPGCLAYGQAGCTTVLLYGFKRDLNAYLAGLGPEAPVRSLAEIRAYNLANADAALKYRQVLADAADRMDTSPDSADTARYLSDRAADIALARGGLDAVFNGPDGAAGTEDDFDAVLFPANRGANAPARAGYPSIVVPGGFVPPAPPLEQPAPFGVTFSGRAFSEPRLIGLAYAFEQATRHRRPPPSTPPLPAAE